MLCLLHFSLVILSSTIYLILVLLVFALFMFVYVIVVISEMCIGKEVQAKQFLV